MEDTKQEVDTPMLYNIYLALEDAYERLREGRMNIRRCIDYLKSNHGFEPHPEYITRDAKERADIAEREGKIAGVKPLRTTYREKI